MQVCRYSDGTQGGSTRPSCKKRRRDSEVRSNKRAQIERSPPCAGSNTSGEDTQSSGGIGCKDELPRRSVRDVADDRIRHEGGDKGIRCHTASKSSGELDLCNRKVGTSGAH